MVLAPVECEREECHVCGSNVTSATSGKHAARTPDDSQTPAPLLPPPSTSTSPPSETWPSVTGRQLRDSVWKAYKQYKAASPSRNQTKQHAQIRSLHLAEHRRIARDHTHTSLLFVYISLSNREQQDKDRLCEKVDSNNQTAHERAQTRFADLGSYAALPTERRIEYLVEKLGISKPRAVKMSTAARRRLMRDFKRMQTDPPAGVSASPIADNVMTWYEPPPSNITYSSSLRSATETMR